MKRILLLLTFACLPHLAGFCPNNEELLIISQVEPIRIIDHKLLAVIKIESNFNSTIINKYGYGGILQIGQEMIEEVNRINKIRGIKKRFELSDRLDVEKSIEIWYIVQSYRNSAYDLKKACKIWNPTASQRYYEKIKAEYQKNIVSL